MTGVTIKGKLWLGHMEVRPREYKRKSETMVTHTSPLYMVHHIALASLGLPMIHLPLPTKYWD